MALFGRLTASEYLRFVGRMYGLDKATTLQRSEELLGFMNLADEQKKLVTDFSHGMQKKLALAAAVIHNPKILFLDEPFEGVDAIASGTLKSMLQRMIARGATIFLTSHVLEIVERLCTHIGIIHRGQLVAQGSIEELRAGVRRAAHLRARAKKPLPPSTADLSLEQIFLEIVGTDRAGNLAAAPPEQDLVAQLDDRPASTPPSRPVMAARDIPAATQLLAIAWLRWRLFVNGFRHPAGQGKIAGTGVFSIILRAHPLAHLSLSGSSALRIRIRFPRLGGGSRADRPFRPDLACCSGESPWCSATPSLSVEPASPPTASSFRPLLAAALSAALWPLSRPARAARTTDSQHHRRLLCRCLPRPSVSPSRIRRSHPPHSSSLQSTPRSNIFLSRMIAVWMERWLATRRAQRGIHRTDGALLRQLPASQLPPSHTA